MIWRFVPPNMRSVALWQGWGQRKGQLWLNLTDIVEMDKLKVYVAAIVLEGFTRPSFELLGSALDRFLMFKMSCCWPWHPLREFTGIVDEIILYRFCSQSDEGYLAHNARLPT